MSKRMTINLNPKAEESLEALNNNHVSWAVRTNTILNAAIIAFKDLTIEEQKKYLVQTRMQDKRRYDYGGSIK